PELRQPAGRGTEHAADARDAAAPGGAGSGICGRRAGLWTTGAGMSGRCAQAEAATLPEPDPEPVDALDDESDFAEPDVDSDLLDDVSDLAAVVEDDSALPFPDRLSVR